MSLIDQDDELRPSRSRERELTLSTGTILGIFFALVLLCGVFFGFGYNMGSKARQAAQTTDPGSSAPSANFGGFSKPSAGSFTTPSSRTHTPASQPAATSNTISSASGSTAPAPIVRQPASVGYPADRPAPRPQPVVITPSSPPPLPISARPTTVASSVPAATTPATVGAQSGTYLVQVAAVSHQEDAQLLVGALRARGYTVASRTSAGDSYYHVQVGPFSNRKDADAMRQRLLTDGYNAVIK